ncbi:unnamed protein product [Notodromas monacha]|uniref:Uncharacterized protein n=1 Tax=Notodromas monacha TaxID=399045 RepID=A0A7R9GDD6_9CRUS|nr:unnamed protein product [Notodromas monacha]CAG0918578.1 unnamed protein product [Notodromas monacha]
MESYGFVMLSHTLRNEVKYHFGCALFAGIVASILTHPPDVLKTKVQCSEAKLTGVEAVRLIVKESGFPGFFRGLVPRLLRRTLLSCVSWTIYERVNILIEMTED